VNLYIGGCSLEQHWSNVRTRGKYQCLVNGREVSSLSIPEALACGPWDVITFQQASHLSGRPQSYFPYLENLSELCHRTCPRAKQYIQQTWAYEVDSTHEAFKDYHSSQGEMFRRLRDAYELASATIHAPLIPVGDVIQLLRQRTDAFDYLRGGRSLCRDGFHLSLDYGRYAAAATWYMTICGGEFVRCSFAPEADGQRADERLLGMIRGAVELICRGGDRKRQDV